MNEADFMKEFGEFKDVFRIVEEPNHSRQVLSTLIKRVNGGENIVDYAEELIYYQNRFLEFGGDMNELLELSMDNLRKD